jgi:ABC-2 type transport system permease protein
MRALKAKAGKYLASGTSALLSKLAYRSDVLGQGVSYAVFVFIFVNLWSAAFKGGAVIAGYTRESAIWYFIVAEIAAFSASDAFRAISEDVKTGAIAYTLGRPYGYLAYQYAQSLGGCLAPQALLVALGCAFGFLFAGPLPVSGWAQIPAVLLSLLMGMSVSFFLQAAISLTAFWVEENTAFFWIYQKLMLVLGTLMPIEFLPASIRPAALLSPFSSIAYAPARLAVAFSPREAVSILGIQAFWLLASALAASLVFKKGVKHVSVQGG